jgi:hypothetical protein
MQNLSEIKLRNIANNKFAFELLEVLKGETVPQEEEIGDMLNHAEHDLKRATRDREIFEKIDPKGEKYQKYVEEANSRIKICKIFLEKFKASE